MSSHYPIFIPSRHRAKYAGTAAQLDSIGIPDYRFIVESDDLTDYRNKYGRERVLELEPEYQLKYETCDEHGTKIPVGACAARNMAWDIAMAENTGWHWCLDDNVKNVAVVVGKDKIYYAQDGEKFLANIERLITRYNNVAMGGPVDWALMYIKVIPKLLEFAANTRIYSYNLIRNSVPFRWRGRYNEDTILSLDMLVAGHATILTKKYMMKKSRTRKMKGGNTEKIYAYGSGSKTRLLKLLYPQYVDIVHRYGRIHHVIQYRKHFKHVPLIRAAQPNG